uniref:Uncharacterized protein n=1 Tax=Glossina palpalis gambiensis TaxID=67801 RepID=A0A1B0BQR0_9MUSC
MQTRSLLRNRLVLEENCLAAYAAVAIAVAVAAAVAAAAAAAAAGGTYPPFKMMGIILNGSVLVSCCHRLLLHARHAVINCASSPLLNIHQHYQHHHQHQHHHHHRPRKQEYMLNTNNQND